MGTGVTFPDGDVEAFRSALIEVHDNYAHYVERCEQKRSEWLDENSAERFVDFIEQTGASERRALHESP